MTTYFHIHGMHCESCKALIEDVCKEIAGISACSVELATGAGKVEHDTTFDRRALELAIRELGEYSITYDDKKL